MTELEILQKAYELLSRRHIQSGLLETSEKDESLRGYCICGALLKAVEWKEPIGALVTKLNKAVRAWTDDGVGDISEFSENCPTSDVLGFIQNEIVELLFVVHENL